MLCNMLYTLHCIVTTVDGMVLAGWSGHMGTALGCNVASQLAKAMNYMLRVGIVYVDTQAMQFNNNN